MKLEKSAIAALGSSLRQINPGLMKSGEGAEPKRRFWYQGNEPYFDVTVEETDDTITWFQITLRSKVVSWRHPQTQLLTGETDELDVPPEVAYYAASKTIRDGAATNWPFVETVRDILAQRPEEAVLKTVKTMLDEHLAQRADGSKA